ncbi:MULTISPECIES: 3-phosphoshikimate 1-carboxyvinyltransferase [Microbacterium]|uniref:3-phosphoshikimate 1-carboxyvinyltransferase n=2 Tax=Microbacteriaceae TaxID=85023 RepID=UPI0007005C6F|nr:MULTISPECIES: 3-phosphoshikimate 1-carboxyvinyltransferase [unclassified Microbacterium]KQS00148.1 3-phosphoshikimate 1-carboxyvinyltransferase [Microbacterium sp. Leaf347]MBN9198595.1 3-phosphoshikimate 1-carboxyvinyltransferase [Microbacterium ginsengisoli]ODU76460.1 MAG: 3-phosphoshikimate 1-carboxyvinyltransferase [Microbacterium sp. SCN 71-21]OJU77685.1 MAG: 3-phosphoshikimate 1-carboxyvinyltransferase [Microbacterium sp. 71-23]
MSAPSYSPASPPWPAPAAGRPVTATVSVPGSKSLTNRELVLAALADGPALVTAPLPSDDSARMIDAIAALGVGVASVPGSGRFGDDLRITPARLHGGSIDCGQAGTVMRFIAPVAGLAEGAVHLTAHHSALHRPMGPLIEALRSLGLTVDDGGTGALPFTVHGTGSVRGGRLEIDASASSQFVSGLLLSAARFDEGLHLVHRGERVPSLPHIEMTLASLRHRGVETSSPREGEWVVAPGPIRAMDVAIEPDLSNAAPFLATAVVTGGEVTVTGWPEASTQPGHLLPELLAAFGATATIAGDALTVTGTGTIDGADLDLSAVGELAPTLVGIAALASSPSRFRGIGHLRGHETDRLAALVANLAAIGVTAYERPDGIEVHPGAAHGGLWRAFHDHRLATTGALLGLVVDGVEVDDIGATAKTLPQFVDLWADMLTTERP